MGDRLEKAENLFREYKLDESREILEQLIDEEPANKNALLLLGKIHSRTQNYGVAMNFFNKVLKIEKNNMEAQTGLQLIRNILQLTNNFYFENAYTDDGLYEFE